MTSENPLPLDEQPELVENTDDDEIVGENHPLFFLGVRLFGEDLAQEFLNKSLSEALNDFFTIFYEYAEQMNEMGYTDPEDPLRETGVIL